MAITYGTLIGQNVATITDTYYDKILRGWMPQGLIFPDLFPQMPSSTYKGRIPKQNTAMPISSNYELAPSGFPVISLDFEATDTYKLRYRGLTATLDYADIEELGGEAQAQSKTLAILNARVQVGREYQIARRMTDPSIMLQYYNVPIQWGDPSADILGDITKIVSIVRTGVNGEPGCGFTPNVAIIPWEVFNILSRHPSLIKAAYVGAVMDANVILTVEKLKAIMNVERILVAKAMYYSNEIGAASTRVDVWGKNTIMAHIDYSPTPAEAKQSLGYTFVPQSSAVGLADFSYTWQTPGILPEMGKQVTKGFMADDVLVDIDCACLLPNVI